MSTWLALLLVGCAPDTNHSAEPRLEPQRPAAGRPAPYFDARTQEAKYYGPGRDELPPGDLAEIRIGWFGPADPDHAAGGPMWVAACLAVVFLNQHLTAWQMVAIIVICSSVAVEAFWSRLKGD